MEIGTSGISGQNALYGMAGTKEKAGFGGELNAGGEDTVAISDQGRQLSQSMQMGGGNGAASSGASVSVSGSSAVSVDELQQELQQKNSEVASTQATVDTLKRQAEADPSKKSELSKKQNELRTLEDEAAELKADVYA